MAQFRNLIVALMLFIGVILYFSLFTVNEKERAALFWLGRVERADFEPGLHWKVPFVQRVEKFDARILTLDAEPERFLTSEKKNVIVDSFVKWRIGETPEAVTRFYTAVAGDEAQANLRLDQIIKDGLRGEFSIRTIQEAVSGDRNVVRTILKKNAEAHAAELGIIIVDVRIKRIDLPLEVSGSVYRRMNAERERVARDFRSRGAEAAERIRAGADRERTILLAEAYRDSELLRGEGDAKSAETYAVAFNQNKEFYSLYRTLNSYKTVFGKPNDVLVLDGDSDYFRYFGKAQIQSVSTDSTAPRSLEWDGK